MKNLLNRRINEKLLVLIFLVGVTFVPQLHISTEFQVRLFAALVMTAFAWLRSWTVKVAQKSIPPEQRNRIEDSDLHSPITVKEHLDNPDIKERLYCARCSKDKPRDQWVLWDDCKYKRQQ